MAEPLEAPRDRRFPGRLGHLRWRRWWPPACQMVEAGRWRRGVLSVCGARDAMTVRRMGGGAGGVAGDEQGSSDGGDLVATVAI
jgi:hypothetical protein